MHYVDVCFFSTVLDCVCFFQLYLTRIGFPYNSAGDTPFMLLPVVYDTANNQTTLAEKKDGPHPTTALYHAGVHVKRFNDYNMPISECSILPVVRDFLMNFSLPSENQPQVQFHFVRVSNLQISAH